MNLFKIKNVISLTFKYYESYNTDLQLTLSNSNLRNSNKFEVTVKFP